MIDCPHCIRKDAAIEALTDSRDRLADVRDRLAVERDHLRAELETAHAALRDFETGYKSLEAQVAAMRSILIDYAFTDRVDFEQMRLEARRALGMGSTP